MPSKRMVPEQESAELSDEIVRLRAELDTATATFDDEQAAHQDTLRLWQRAKAEIAALTEQRDRALTALREPSEAAVAAAAKAECDFQVGESNSIWDSPLTNRDYRIEKMRAALTAAARAGG